MLNHFSCIWICDPVYCSLQALLSMGFSRQEYWIRLPCSPPGDLPDPGIKLASPMTPSLTGGFFTTGATWEAPVLSRVCLVAQLYLTVTSRTVALQAPLSLGFFKNTGMGCHFPPPRDLPHQRLNPPPVSPALQVESLPTENIIILRIRSIRKLCVSRYFQNYPASEPCLSPFWWRHLVPNFFLTYNLF